MDSHSPDFKSLPLVDDIARPSFTLGILAGYSGMNHFLNAQEVFH